MLIVLTGAFDVRERQHLGSRSRRPDRLQTLSRWSNHSAKGRCRPASSSHFECDGSLTQLAPLQKYRKRLHRHSLLSSEGENQILPNSAKLQVLHLFSNSGRERRALLDLGSAQNDHQQRHARLLPSGNLQEEQVDVLPRENQDEARLQQDAHGRREGRLARSSRSGRRGASHLLAALQRTR